LDVAWRSSFTYELTNTRRAHLHLHNFLLLQLVGVYSKIVLRPVDLGHVCRGIRRREYQHARDIRLDMWRLFSNCVKFHSHCNNKEAVPSFVSIAMHLREFFNGLWQEYMLPSEEPLDSTDGLKNKHVQIDIRRRRVARKKRMDNSYLMGVSKPFAVKAAVALSEFIDNGGRVDGLDEEALWDASDTGEYTEVVSNLREFHTSLPAKVSVNDYLLDDFFKGLRRCHAVLEENLDLRNRISLRLDRFFWKRAISLHEANARGVTQSSIWGNMVAAIWARESSKKPYWPALCLGILSPPEQRESWHKAVTERNESRLPEKLRNQLLIARQKCEINQQKAGMQFSYFLVEFLGTHEFIWVRETDIVEKFDPEDDPNKSLAAYNSKRKRDSRRGASAVVGSKTYAAALQECAWAYEEYENIMNIDDEDWENEETGEEEKIMDYSYGILALSDDEADDEDVHGYKYIEDAMSPSDVEEANCLLTYDGILKTEPGKKSKAKRPPQVLVKKKVEDKSKKETAEYAKKAKAEQVNKKFRDREEKKELREVERRRKKRSRDREKALKDAASVKKKRSRGTLDVDDDERGLARDKRSRATAIVKAYLSRLSRSQEDCKSLVYNGVMTIPSAMVESTGLIGMSLAFRSAARELAMPDETESTKSMKPWTAIDTSKGKTSAERVEKLEMQIELAKAEIARVKANTMRRKQLTEQAILDRKEQDAEINEADIAARMNHFKKKSKSSPKSTSKTDDTPTSKISLEVGGSVLTDAKNELPDTAIKDGDHSIAAEMSEAAHDFPTPRLLEKDLVINCDTQADEAQPESDAEMAEAVDAQTGSNAETADDIGILASVTHLQHKN
jgi:alkylated DNA nucleotide flippase Atl1